MRKDLSTLLRAATPVILIVNGVMEKALIESSRKSSIHIVGFTSTTKEKTCMDFVHLGWRGVLSWTNLGTAVGARIARFIGFP